MNHKTIEFAAMDKYIEEASKENCIDHSSKERELKYCIEQPSSISMEVSNSSDLCNAFIKVEEEFINFKTENEDGEIRDEDWEDGINFDLPLEPLVEIVEASNAFHKENPLGESLKDFKAIRRIYKYSLLSKCPGCIFEFNQRLIESQISDRLNEKLIRCSQLILEPDKKDCILIHTFKNLFQCLECDYMSYQIGEIFHHMLTHAKTAVNKCCICWRDFINIDSLIKHLIIHEEESRSNVFKCYSCKFERNQSRLFIRHLVNCKGERYLKCFICKYKCRKKYMISEHMLTHAKKVMICKHCNFNCSYKDCKDKHICKSYRVFNRMNAECLSIPSKKPQKVKKTNIKHQRSSMKKLEALWFDSFASHKSFPKSGKDERLREILLKREIMKIQKIKNVHDRKFISLAANVRFFRRGLTKKQIRRVVYEVEKYFFHPKRFPKEDFVKKSKVDRKKTKRKKKFQDLKNPKSSMVGFHQEEYELVKESSESNHKTSVNDVVLIKREPGERSSESDQQILSDIPDDMDEISLSELMVTFAPPPSEPLNPISGDRKKTKRKKKFQDLKNPKSSMVGFHQEEYELVKESSESNHKTSVNDVVLIKREPGERSSESDQQILSDIPDDMDEIPLSELVVTFAPPPSEPLNPISGDRKKTKRKKKFQDLKNPKSSMVGFHQEEYELVKESSESNHKTSVNDVVLIKREPGDRSSESDQQILSDIPDDMDEIPLSELVVTFAPPPSEPLNPISGNRKKTKWKKKFQDLKNPKSSMVGFHQEEYELVKESSESNHKTSVNDVVLIKREPGERSSESDQQILSDIPDDMDEIPLSELVVTFAPPPSEPLNPISGEPFLKVNPPGIKFRWSLEEKLEAFWCYTFAKHKSFPSEGRDLRLRDVLLKRGIIDRNKLLITPIARFYVLASRVKLGKTAITIEEIERVKTEVEDYLKHPPTEDTVKTDDDDESVFVMEEPLIDDMENKECLEKKPRIKTDDDENAFVFEKSWPENVEFILGL